MLTEMKKTSSATIQWQRKTISRILVSAATLILIVVGAFIWLWQQYDYESSIEATGIHVIIDSSGNIIAQDVSDETWKLFIEWLEGAKDGEN